MMRKLLAVLVLVVVGLSLPGQAKMRGPSTPEERSRALGYIQSLEQNPLSHDSLDKRLWLTQWIVEVPDFTVHISYKVLDSLDKVNDTYSNQLRMQAVYSQAAYILQHPEVKNEVRLKAAGLSGTLRAYQSIQRFDPTARYPLLDNLLSLQKQGKLEQYVQKHMDKPCDN